MKTNEERIKAIRSAKSTLLCLVRNNKIDTDWYELILDTLVELDDVEEDILNYNPKFI